MQNRSSSLFSIQTLYSAFFDSENRWQTTIGMGLVTACISGFILYDTWYSIVEIWLRSDTFAHGILVLPIFIWLVWRQRNDLKTLHSQPDWLAVCLVPIAGITWLTTGLAGLQVGQHIAAVAVFILVLWAVIGRHYARALKFPLFFLFFMAPVGEEFVPMLMVLTADVTVYALRVVSIPVYREGLYFSLPTGEWSVVEACSGIRYLIASVTLGTLYAYVTYRQLWRKALFIGLAIVVPLAANGIRAFIIVLIGHFSNMELATGADHLVYGWLFFGLVMYVLFLFGTIFEEKNSKSDLLENSNDDSSLKLSHSGDTKPHVFSTAYEKDRIIKNFVFIATILATILIWPIWANSIQTHTNDIDTNENERKSTLPAGLSSPTENRDGINSVDNTSVWAPSISGYKSIHSSSLITSASVEFSAWVFMYGSQTQGNEMISSSNTIVNSGDAQWRSTDKSEIVISIGDRDLSDKITINQHVLKSSDETTIVWYWYKIRETHTNSPITAKLLEMRDKLFLKRADSKMYILASQSQQNELIQDLEEAVFRILDKNMTE